MSAITRHKDYMALRLWHAQTGSFAYYIEGRVERARRDNAPQDALFKRDGEWTTVADLDDDHDFRAALEKELTR